MKLYILKKKKLNTILLLYIIFISYYRTLLYKKNIQINIDYYYKYF